MKILFLERFQFKNGVSTFNKTIISEMKEFQIKVSSDTKDITDEYDYYIIDHSYWYEHIKNKSKIIHVIHSLDNQDFHIGCKEANKIITLSKRAKIKIKNIYNRDSLQIEQPVDTEKYYYKGCRETPMVIFQNDHRNGMVNLPLLISLTNINNLSLVSNSKNFFIDKPVNVIEKMEMSDISICYGRCAIESMSMGLNTIIYGINGGDGLVTLDNIDLLKSRNFSGSFGEIGTPFNDNMVLEKLQNNIEKYSNDTKGLREYIVEHNDIKNVTKKIINLL